MRTNPFTKMLVAAMVLATALVAFTPTAEAQQQASMTMTLTPTTEQVKPLQGPITISGSITFTGTNEAGATAVSGIPITYTVSNQPPWAQVVISPASDVIIPPAPNPTQPQVFSSTKQFTLSITATDQAPAFQPGTIEISAVTTPGSGGKAANAKANTPVTAAYFSIIDVQLPESIKVERPQQAVTFPLKISNFGNANTKVSFEVLKASEGLIAQTPIPVILQSKQAGGTQNTADVALSIQTPYKNGYMNEVGQVDYKITSAYALDPKLKGDETNVGVIVTTKGFYVPGPSPLLLVGLIGVAAVLFRRFRND